MLNKNTIDFRIALITCEQKPELSDDDALLLPYLKEKNIAFEVHPWSRKEIDWKDFDALVIRSSWDYYLKEIEFRLWLDYLESEKIFVLNKPEIVRWNVNKKYLSELITADIRIPETIFIQKHEKFSLADHFKSAGWLQGVLKPAVSAGAYLTWIVTAENVNNDQKRLDDLILENDFIFQKYLPEIKTEGEISLMFFAGKFSHAVLKKAMSDDFRVQYSYGGTAIEYFPDSRLLEQSFELINSKSLDHCLYTRIDWIKVNGDYLIMEVELIEPVLYFAQNTKAPALFIDALIHAIEKHK
jgi:glutathione synthase/RimK-type ligase-like ATP-grasp enzyme